jgi:hypothetical protein
VTDEREKTAVAKRAGGHRPPLQHVIPRESSALVTEVNRHHNAPCSPRLGTPTSQG